MSKGKSSLQDLSLIFLSRKVKFKRMLSLGLADSVTSPDRLGKEVQGKTDDECICLCEINQSFMNCLFFSHKTK